MALEEEKCSMVLHGIISSAEKQEGKGISRPTKSVGSSFDDKPLWIHTKALNGGGKSGHVTFCNKKVMDSYS